MRIIFLTSILLFTSCQKEVNCTPQENKMDRLEQVLSFYANNFYQNEAYVGENGQVVYFDDPEWNDSMPLMSKGELESRYFNAKQEYMQCLQRK